MPNFNPAKHNNALNPYTLSTEKQLEVMEAVDDSRLTNPPGDYFRLELEGRNIDIPKLEVVSKETEDGKITTVSTAAYIRKLLKIKE